MGDSLYVNRDFFAYVLFFSLCVKYYKVYCIVIIIIYLTFMNKCLGFLVLKKHPFL